MKLNLRPLLLALVLGAGILPITSQASLVAFTNFGYGGTTASWDTFYGPNNQSSFSFVTGTVGNPVNTPTNLTLAVTANGLATGPAGSDFSFPGDRDLFYTFTASPVTFTITSYVGVGETLTSFSFQSLKATGSAGGISNVTLNGAAATVTGGSGNLATYEWTGLSLTAGSQLVLSAQATTDHTAMDAFQIQSNTALVPEPSTYALMAAGLLMLGFMVRKKLA